MSNTKPIHQTVSVLGILAFVQMAACAANLSEDQVLERQYAAVERKASIREFITVCETNNNVVVYTGRTTHKLHDPIKRVPSHVNRSDYQCTTPREVQRMLVEIGL